MNAERPRRGERGRHVDRLGGVRGREDVAESIGRVGRPGHGFARPVGGSEGRDRKKGEKGQQYAGQP